MWVSFPEEMALKLNLEGIRRSLSMDEKANSPACSVGQDGNKASKKLKELSEEKSKFQFS